MAHIKRTHRHRRHRYRSSEEGDAPRVSFLHHGYDSKLFRTLRKRYPIVDLKYFKQIFFGTFSPQDSIKLSRTYIPVNDEIQEASDLNRLLRYFEVYGQAICHYAQPNVAIQLQQALSDYRVRLYELSAYYNFDSIRRYHYAFMTARILYGQDDPISWITEDRRCTELLVRIEDDTPSSPVEASCSEDLRYM